MEVPAFTSHTVALPTRKAQSRGDGDQAVLAQPHFCLLKQPVDTARKRVTKSIFGLILSDYHA